MSLVINLKGMGIFNKEAGRVPVAKRIVRRFFVSYPGKSNKSLDRDETRELDSFRAFKERESVVHGDQ